MRTIKDIGPFLYNYIMLKKNYPKIREYIYNYLNNNKDLYKNNYMIFNKNFISAYEYIP